MSGRRERLRFPGGAGHALAGVLELPDGEPTSGAVFAPCFTCPKDAKAIVRISQRLAEHGCAVLRYDVTGTGQSDGNFRDTTFASQVEDLKAAAVFLDSSGHTPSLVIGISLGGAVAVTAAKDIPSARAVVAINAPADTQHLRDLLVGMAPEIMAVGEAELSLVGIRVTIGRALVDDLPRHDIEDHVAALGLPLLVVHAVDDAIVPVAHGERLFTAARQPKSFAAITGADHLLLRPPAAADHVAEVLGLSLCQHAG